MRKYNNKFQKLNGNLKEMMVGLTMMKLQINY